MTDMDWALHAACSLDPAWTDENYIDDVTSEMMKETCAECPVRKQCAQFALETRAETAMYAGVWLPARMCGSRPHVKYPGAVRELQLIAEGKA